MGVKTIPADEYVATLLCGRQCIESKEFPLENDRDFVMSLILAMEYDAETSPYSLEFLDGAIEKNGYSIPNMMIRWRRPG